MKKAVRYIIKLAALLLILAAMASGVFTGVLYIAFSPLPEFIGMAAVIALIGGAAAVFVFITAKISPLGEEYDPKASAKLTVSYLLPVMIIGTCFAARDNIADETEKALAKSWVRNADCIVNYQNTGDTHDRLCGTELCQSSAAVNYSDMTVGLIFDGYPFGCTEKVRLSKASSLPMEYIQYRGQLAAPGKYFYSFRDREATDIYGFRRTSGIGVEMADGSFWYSDTKSDSLDFDGISARIYAAKQNADIIIPYSSTKLPAAALDIETESILIDTDGLTLTVIFAYEHDGKDIITCCASIPLAETTENPYPIVQRSFEHDGCTVQACAAREYSEWNKNRSDGFIVTLPDGKMYDAAEWGFYNIIN